MRDVAADAAQRSFEYDSMTDLYSRFLAEDILPAAEHHLATAAIGGATAGQCRWRISSDPARRAAMQTSASALPLAFAVCSTEA